MIDRRAFLKLGALGGAGLVTGCGWDGGDALRPGLHAISRVNDWVSEKILYSPTRLAPTYPVSARAARLPAYFISPSLPRLLDPGSWRLEVTGLVRRPESLSLADLEQMPRVTYTVKHHCVEGWSAVATWHGTPVSALIERCRPTPDARYLLFTSFDAGYTNGWDLASAMHPQTILAYGMNDRPLPAAHGAPLRLYAPIKLGYKMTKYLTGIRFTAVRPLGYWEERGYPWFAGV
jgi:DMSO/TMAO reductase YedYZ molybdopterin-dependent catalytic subunit